MLLVCIVGLIGMVSSFLSNIGGGGGALIMLPALLALGVAPLDAIGTIKLGALGLVIGSAFSSRGTGLARKDYIVPIIIIIALAAVMGPQISLNFSDEAVKVISSVLIVVTAVASILSWRRGTESKAVSPARRNVGYGLYLVVAVLLAGFGSAVGLLSSYVLIGFLGMSALETTATRRLAGLVGIPLQLIFFAASGHIDLALGAALLAGNVIGGYFGLKLAILKGNLFVKRAMAVTSIVLVASLFI